MPRNKSKSKRKGKAKTAKPRKGAKKVEAATKSTTTPTVTVTLQPAPAPTPTSVQPHLPKIEETAPEPKAIEAAPIRAREFDPHFKYEISKMHGGEKLKQCFQCGTCTSDCPIARFSDSYRPRTIIRMAQLGLKDRVLSSDTLWLCAACFTCTDRCPQGVEVASVIRILKNAAVEQGHIPSVFKELGSSILKSGVAYQIPELRLKKRAEVGLPPLPKSCPEAIAKLADATGLLKVLKEGGRG